MNQFVGLKYKECQKLHYYLSLKSISFRVEIQILEFWRDKYYYVINTYVLNREKKSDNRLKSLIGEYYQNEVIQFQQSLYKTILNNKDGKEICLLFG